MDSLNASLDEYNENSRKSPEPNFGLYPNRSSAQLGNWFWGNATKSQADFASLVKLITDDQFKPQEVAGTPFTSIFQELGGASSEEQVGEWTEVEVPVEVPFGSKDRQPKTLLVPGLFYRSLIDVIRLACESKHAETFHFTPYRLIWQPGQGAPDQEVEGEFYTSKDLLNAHDDVQRLPREDGCSLPRAVVALMVASDSTHLTQFGTASLWPAYMMLGNQSKYERGKQSTHGLHHIAYFPKVINHFSDNVSVYLINHHCPASRKCPGLYP